MAHKLAYCSVVYRRVTSWNCTSDLFPMRNGVHTRGTRDFLLQGRLRRSGRGDGRKGRKSASRRDIISIHKPGIAVAARRSIRRRKWSHGDVSPSIRLR